MFMSIHFLYEKSIVELNRLRYLISNKFCCMLIPVTLGAAIIGHSRCDIVETLRYTVFVYGYG